MLVVKQDIDGKGKRLVTTQPFKKDEVICRIETYETIVSPTYTSVQISQTQSIEEFHLAHLNHNCSPNIVVDTTEMEVRAARDIAAGEDLTFFYPSTEWDMSTPFVCLCGSPNCLRLVAGAKYLNLDVLSQYFINRHIGIMALECLTRLHSVKFHQVSTNNTMKSLLH